MSTKEHNEELARLVKAFEDALSAAEAYATEHDLSFNISPEYGMGGYFAKIVGWKASDLGVEEGTFGWYASSVGC